MAYAQGSDTERTVLGNKVAAFGTFTQTSGDTGGEVKTGLSAVDYFEMTGLKTYSASGGTITATTLDPGAAQSGFWLAIGRD